MSHAQCVRLDRPALPCLFLKHTRTHLRTCTELRVTYGIDNRAGHCAINVETALEVRFCTCPAAGTKTFRSTILGSQIVEMELYSSCVSVALGSQEGAKYGT